jgi:hypothetical protein
MIDALIKRVSVTYKCYELIIGWKYKKYNLLKKMSDFKKNCKKQRVKMTTKLNCSKNEINLQINNSWMTGFCLIVIIKWYNKNLI